MLKIDKLSIAYGETLILRDIDLDIAPGQVVCLMGRNGVGKTTLLKGIMGLLRPRSGRILFEGRDAPGDGAATAPSFVYQTRRLAAHPVRSLRKLIGLGVEDTDITWTRPEQRARAGIGYVPQGREIFPHLTVQENLQVGLLAHPSRRMALRDLIPNFLYGLKSFSTLKGFVRQLAGKAQIEVPEYVFNYFPMLRTMLDRPGGLLSGGQQQQLAIARAMLAEPKLLILDEPTEGIQPSIITLIGDVLKSLKKDGKVSILLVEQYLEFALRLADRYYVMEKGAIVLQGDSAEKDKEAIKPYLAF